MKMSVEQQGEVRLIHLSGRLDGTTMQEVEQGFLDLVEQGTTRFVFDLSELEYISSAGLRVMLLSVKKMRAIGGKIALCSLTENVQEVFHISGFSTIFSIFSVREEALRYVEA